MFSRSARKWEVGKDELTQREEVGIVCFEKREGDGRVKRLDKNINVLGKP